MVEIQLGNIYIDVIRHVFRKASYFKRSSLSYKRTALINTFCLTNQTNRDAHLDLTIVSNFQKVSVKDDFTYRVELHLL
jgi:hypothetical protein